MVMAVLSVIPTDNVSATDIRDTLNHHGGSCDNNLTTFFASSAKINPFAKYKPVQYPWDFQTDNREWWKSINMDCQVSLNLVTTLSAIKTLYDNGANQWTFKYWTATPTHPYRLGDFRGYNPSAKSCIDMLSYDSTAQVTSSVGTNVWLTIHYREQNNNELSFADIPWNLGGGTLDSFYPGIVFYTTANSTLKIITMSSTVGTSALNETILLPVTKSDVGTLYMYPILAQEPHTTATSTLKNGTYVTPMPNGSKISITIEEIAPFTVTFNTSSSYFNNISGTYELHASYTITATQTGSFSGAWYYTPVDSEGLPCGQTYADPNLSQ